MKFQKGNKINVGKKCKQSTKIKIGNANRGEKNGWYSHGMYKTRFHRIWRIMKNRCSTNTHGDNRHMTYINRGIKVCDRWLKFENFRDDMYGSYLEHTKKFGEKETTIDRINNDGNYESGNCRWATKQEQSNNRRVTLQFFLNKKSYTIRELSNIYNITYKNLFNRLVIYKWPIKRAISRKCFYERHKK